MQSSLFWIHSSLSLYQDTNIFYLHRHPYIDFGHRAIAHVSLLAALISIHCPIKPLYYSWAGFKEKVLFNQHWYWAPVKLKLVLVVYFYWFSFSVLTHLHSTLYASKNITGGRSWTGKKIWSHLLRELWWREEVPEAEAVDQAGEDGVVCPQLGAHRPLTAPVPVSFIWGFWSWKVPEVAGEELLQVPQKSYWGFEP